MCLTRDSALSVATAKAGVAREEDYVDPWETSEMPIMTISSFNTPSIAFLSTYCVCAG